MKLKKIIFSVLTILILGGCMDMGLWFAMKTAKVKLGTGEEGCRNVEKYLYERYGEEFVCGYAGYTTGDISPEIYGEAYTVYAKIYENQDYWDNVFRVFGRRFDGGPYTYRDGYFGVYGRETYRQYVEEILKPLFNGKEYYVGVKPYDEQVFVNEITKDTKISELFDATLNSENKVNVDYYIWVLDGDYNDLESLQELSFEIAEKLKEHKLLGRIMLNSLFYDKKELFIEHQDYYLFKILTGEKYKKYYEEGTKYHDGYMSDLLNEIQNIKFISLPWTISVRIDAESDVKNEIKIYIDNAVVE